MGLIQRIQTIFSSKVNHALDAVEDPRETLDYAYERQRQQYKKLKQSIVTVATEKNRLVQQRSRAQDEITRWEQTARNFLATGDEEQAAVAVERKQAAQRQLDGLAGQIDSMEQELENLKDLDKQMVTKLSAMREQKEMLKARYTAAKAQTDVQSALGQYSTISEDWQDMFDRAQEKTLATAARAQALGELSAADMPHALPPGAADPVQAELARLKSEMLTSEATQ